jgi:NADPH:quinone reductase-like Zn-dependent oxidoreductase
VRALLCKEYGPADTLVIEDVEPQAVRGHGVRVKVSAAGLNFPDTLIIEGKYQLKPKMPFSPGGEWKSVRKSPASNPATGWPA